MNKHKLLSSFSLLASAVLFTGCVDNNYDLSDLDKTAQVKVNDLSLGVKIDDVELKSIIEVKDGDRVQIIDGQYAVLEKNTFQSQNIKIDAIKLKSAPIPDNTKTIDVPDVSKIFALGQPVYLDLSSENSPFDFEATDVDDNIVSVQEFGCELKIIITLSLKGIEKHVNSFLLTGMKLQLPKGLKNLVPNDKNDKYDVTTGVYTVTDTRVKGTQAKLNLSCDRVDFNAAGAVFDKQARKMHFKDNLKVTAGQAKLTKEDFITLENLPKKVSYTTSFNLADIVINKFSGQFQYTIKEITSPEIEVNDLPDFLTQKGTNLVLANPQLYLTINNPLSEYGIRANMDLNVTVKRPNLPDAQYPMNNPLQISSSPTAEYCLSPLKPSAYYTPYPNATYHQYADLGRLLSGDGVPNKVKLKIDVINPKVPVQTIIDFLLGKDFGKLEGSYCFFAPLQLAGDARVVYADTLSGWDSESLRKLTVQKLNIRTSITSNLPVDVKFNGYPIDKKGKQINNVVLEGATIPAYAKNYPVNIVSTGTISGLDGIRFEAVVTPKDGQDASSLRPDMKLKLSGVHPTVSGYYKAQL